MIKMPVSVHEPLSRHPYTVQYMKMFHIDLYSELDSTFRRTFSKGFLRPDKNEVGIQQQPLLQIK